jgi:hypothetical protein
LHAVPVIALSAGTSLVLSRTICTFLPQPRDPQLHD